MKRTLVLALALAALPNLAPAQPRGAPASDATGVASCDEQVQLWRQCIDASGKSAPEKASAHGEVNRFINDVRSSTGANRRGLERACTSTAEGYRRMLADGSCRRGVTGLFDDVRRR